MTRASENWRKPLILASGSPRRLALLEQIGIRPTAIIPAEVDETPKAFEAPRLLATRLARIKGEAALKIAGHDPKLQDALVLAADTVVAVGRRVLPKTELVDEAAACLRLLSGRSHRVYTGLALITPSGSLRQRLVETRVRFKRLTKDDLEAYLASGEWQGKAGGYAIQGIAGSFVVKLSGSYPNVVGLPLHETANLLEGEGYPIRFDWLNRT